MTKKLSEVSVAYISNAYHLDLARREFERQATNMLEHVEQELNNIARRMGPESDVIRWRNPMVEFPQREIAWLNFRANANITLDLRPRGFKNFKKDAAYLYFEVLFDDDSRSFVFQARFENQSVSDAFRDLDEQIIEIARNPEEKLNFPNSDHIKASTAILFRHSIDEELWDNLHSRVTNAIRVCEAATVKLLARAAVQLEAAADTGVISAEG